MSVFFPFPWPLGLSGKSCDFCPCFPHWNQIPTFIILALLVGVEYVRAAKMSIVSGEMGKFSAYMVGVWSNLLMVLSNEMEKLNRPFNSAWDIGRATLIFFFKPWVY